jgi:hypothetical protein
MDPDVIIIVIFFLVLICCEQRRPDTPGAEASTWIWSSLKPSPSWFERLR